MNIHRRLHGKQPLKAGDFQRWLALFNATLDEGYSGEQTERARRVLIVVPETLLHQWLVEMLRRFNLHFKIFDKERCENLIEENEYENIFHSEQLVLCSIDFLVNNADMFEQCVFGEWDLMVVDEAHHLQWSAEEPSIEYMVVEQLSNQTKGVLLLTATPEQLGKESHFARLRLLDPDRFPDFQQFVDEEENYEPYAQVIEDLLSHIGSRARLESTSWSNISLGLPYSRRSTLPAG